MRGPRLSLSFFFLLLFFLFFFDGVVVEKMKHHIAGQDRAGQDVRPSLPEGCVRVCVCVFSYGDSVLARGGWWGGRARNRCLCLFGRSPLGRSIWSVGRDRCVRACRPRWCMFPFFPLALSSLVVVVVVYFFAYGTNQHASLLHFIDFCSCFCSVVIVLLVG